MSDRPWLSWLEEDEATGELADVYAWAEEHFGWVPPAVKIFSVRPEVAVAQNGLRRVLLGDASSLGARRSDLIGAAVSGINRCQYCGTAHSGLLRLRAELDADDAVLAYRDWRALELSAADRAMLEFAEKLTLTPAQMTADDIAELRANGFTDENVFDIVVLTAYRNFMNRVNDGLGVPTADLHRKFGLDHVRAITES
jgi:uncharacterized peroxidase-related enzyme